MTVAAWTGDSAFENVPVLPWYLRYCFTAAELQATIARLEARISALETPPLESQSLQNQAAKEPG